MDNNISNSWWDNYRNTVKFTKLFHELVDLLDEKEDVARNMLNSAKKKNPGKAEIWYLERLITELKKENIVNLAH